jgi:hypothetical protein
LTCIETFAAGVNQSLKTGDTVSQVGIVNCCPSNLSGSTLPPSPLPCVKE